MENRASQECFSASYPTHPEQEQPSFPALLLHNVLDSPGDEGQHHGWLAQHQGRAATLPAFPSVQYAHFGADHSRPNDSERPQFDVATHRGDTRRSTYPEFSQASQSPFGIQRTVHDQYQTSHYDYAARSPLSSTHSCDHSRPSGDDSPACSDGSHGSGGSVPLSSYSPTSVSTTSSNVHSQSSGQDVYMREAHDAQRDEGHVGYRDPSRHPGIEHIDHPVAFERIGRVATSQLTQQDPYYHQRPQEHAAGAPNALRAVSVVPRQSDSSHVRVTRVGTIDSGTAEAPLTSPLSELRQQHGQAGYATNVTTISLPVHPPAAVADNTQAQRGAPSGPDGIPDATPYVRHLLGLPPDQRVNLDALPDPPAGQRPDFPLPTLIKLAILGSPNKRLTLQGIYAALIDRFQWFKDHANEIAWKNSIRHNLSLNLTFRKIPRPLSEHGKGSYWVVDYSQGEGTKRPRKRNKKPTKSGMSRSEEIDTDDESDDSDDEGDAVGGSGSQSQAASTVSGETREIVIPSRPAASGGHTVSQTRGSSSSSAARSAARRSHSPYSMGAQPAHQTQGRPQAQAAAASMNPLQTFSQMHISQTSPTVSTSSATRTGMQQMQSAPTASGYMYRHGQGQVPDAMSSSFAVPSSPVSVSHSSAHSQRAGHSASHASSAASSRQSSVHPQTTGYQTPSHVSSPSAASSHSSVHSHATGYPTAAHVFSASAAASRHSSTQPSASSGQILSHPRTAGHATVLQTSSASTSFEQTSMGHRSTVPTSSASASSSPRHVSRYTSPTSSSSYAFSPLSSLPQTPSETGTQARGPIDVHASHRTHAAGSSASAYAAAQRGASSRPHEHDKDNGNGSSGSIRK